MNAIDNIGTIDMTSTEDMALLDALLSPEGSITDTLDLSEESAAADAALSETVAAADADDDLDLDNIDLDGIDLDGDEAALLQAALSAEGANSVEELPAVAASTEAAAPEEPKKKAAPKKPSTARTTYVNAKASDVLKSRLNGDVSNTIVLEFADADLSTEELAAKQTELLDLLNVRPHQSKDGSTQKKVAEKIVMLFAYLKNGGSLNEVLRRTFTLLAKDGYVQMGKTGNLTADLLAKPYSPGTANAQGGQMMQMLPLLRIALPDTANKGRLVVNPESVIFTRMVELLGLAK